MTTLLRSIYLLTIVWSVVGCHTPRRQLKKAIKRVHWQQKTQSKTAHSASLLSQHSREAESNNRISESTNRYIQNYITTQQDSIKFDSLTLAKVTTELENVDKKTDLEAVRTTIAKANLILVKSKRRLRIFDKKTAVIIDFLNHDTFSKAEINTFFAPGNYELTPEQLNQCKNLIDPIVKKIFLFSDRYKRRFAIMQGEIIVTGYSDATPIVVGSRLYMDLTQRLDRENKIVSPSQSDMNRKLSELRAKTIKVIIEKIIQERKKKKNRLQITVQALGRGDEIPPFLAGKASRDDSRRRIVTFYWVLLPIL